MFPVLILLNPLGFFFFNDTATTEIYTLSLHDALPISSTLITGCPAARCSLACAAIYRNWASRSGDRKSTRLNSSHGYISYAVFCLKKKKKLLKISEDHDTIYTVRSYME